MNDERLFRFLRSLGDAFLAADSQFQIPEIAPPKDSEEPKQKPSKAMGFLYNAFSFGPCIAYACIAVAGAFVGIYGWWFAIICALLLTSPIIVGANNKTKNS